MTDEQQVKSNFQEDVKNEEASLLHPFFSIWIYPRDTIRQIVDRNPHQHVLFLAGLSGLALLLDRTMGQNLGDIIQIIYLIPLIVLGGPIIGLLVMYLGGFVLRWTGKIFGGQADVQEVRAAIAWSSLPSLMVSLFNLPILVFFQEEAFRSMTPRTDAILHSNLIYLQLISIYSFVWMLLGIVFTLWSFVLLLKTVAEVHRFSAWKGLLTVAIPIIGLLVSLIGLSIIAS